MRAIQFYGKGDVRLNENIKTPVAGKGRVRIRPAFVGICGSGLTLYESSPSIEEGD
jgi:threonine dehydrogenase-like Zn-dependent dehydrogenase